MKYEKVFSIKSDKSILVREIYRLKRELVVETHRADENLRALRALWDQWDSRPAPNSLCRIEGMGCEHIPGNDECVGCGNWQVREVEAA